MKRPVQFFVSSGNVFADLGLPDAEYLLAKSDLAIEIAAVIAQRGLTQIQAATLLGTTQPKVSDLLRGQLDGFSIERLIRFLNALDRDVRILVSPKPRKQPRGRLFVDTAARSITVSTKPGTPSTPDRKRKAAADELRPSYDFDYGKAQPNRFAVRVQKGPADGVRDGGQAAQRGLDDVQAGRVVDDKELDESLEKAFKRGRRK